MTLTLTTQALPQNGPLKRIVALGDSYSSGEGNPPFDIDTVQPGDTCHRSPQAWPNLVGVTASLACSGATLIDLSEGQMQGAPDNTGQIARLAALNATAPVDDVTITIGGNDLGFSQILTDCVEQHCLRQLSKSEAKAQSVANTLATKFLPAIRTAAPNASILVVGYPQLLPNSHADVHDCPWLTSRNLSVMNRLESDFNSDLQRAAQQSNVTFVSTASALSGHELCTSSPWIVPLSHHCIPGDPTASYCGHPIENAIDHGQRNIADAVRQALAGPSVKPATALDLTGLIRDDWYTHGGGVSIRPDGTFSFIYRTYRTCGQDAPPCDTLHTDTHVIDSGGFVTGRITAGATPRWSGVISGASEPGSWPVGDITVSYDASTDSLHIQPASGNFQQGVVVCGPNAPESFCGA